MSLYNETAYFLEDDAPEGSLKSQVYDFRGAELKSTRENIYALASKAIQWSPILAEIIENCTLLEQERKLSPALALLLVHDLLLKKKGIASPETHPLRQAIERHKARLQAELTRSRIKHGYSTIEEFKSAVKDNKIVIPGVRSAKPLPRDPRWVRINTLKTTLKAQLETTFAGRTVVTSLADLFKTAEGNTIYHDPHIPNLVAIPTGKELIKSSAYLNGDLILQDKASCFPAYLLNLKPNEGEIMDACAAPGNKSTHLAAIASEVCRGDLKQKISAIERDKIRGETLRETLKKTGANEIVRVYNGRSFPFLKWELDYWSNITALLIDPSCSGSGMNGRVEGTLVLPKRKESETSIKRSVSQRTKQRDSKLVQNTESPAKSNRGAAVNKADRLWPLTEFQQRTLNHALEHPNARKIVYSTCSIFAEENEHIVFRALASPMGRTNGWRLQRRDEQIEGMRNWHVRGWKGACEKLEDQSDMKEGDLAESCIRCRRNTEDGTQGFFVACFVRDGMPEDNWSEEDEWQGLSDLETEEWRGYEVVSVPESRAELHHDL